MASLATDIVSVLDVDGIEPVNTQDKISSALESAPEISDEDSGSSISSDEEKDGYQGGENLTSDESFKSTEETKRTKKNFANKKTRFISEAKRAIRMKQTTPALSNTNMPVDSSKINDGIFGSSIVYDALSNQDKTKEGLYNDFALELSSTSTSSCEENPIVDMEGKHVMDHSKSAKSEKEGTSSKSNKSAASRVQNNKKRKIEKSKDEDAGETKAKKRSKSRHLRKNIKDILKADSLQAEAIEAKAEEQDRLKRLQEAQATQRKLFQEVLSKQNILQWESKKESENQHNHLLIPQSNTSSIALKQSNNEVIDITGSSEEENTNAKKKNELTKSSEKLSVLETAASFQRKRSEEFAINERNSEKLAAFGSGPTLIPSEKAKKNEIILDHSSSDDCKIVEYEDVLNESDEEDQDNSGMHVDDQMNIAQCFGESKVKKVLVNVGHPSDEPDIFLPHQIQQIIKPHQIGGIRFLYDNLIENLKRFKSSQGFGCILAHAMGLGKTLQVITFCDIFLGNTNSKRILCIVPINTIQNWLAEFNKWIPLAKNEKNSADISETKFRNFEVYLLNDTAKNLEQRAKVIFKWKDNGGVLLMGYELFRMLATKKQRRKRKKKANSHICIDLEEEDLEKSNLEEIQKVLINPGPDLVVCDEGHRIKNAHASTSQALKAISTKRRLVLTGYPLQNNLIEYWCMVDFVRPNYLGNKVEFANMFERPIQNGLCVDSTAKDVRVMMHRAHVLYQELKGFVQRRSHNVLQETLPPKKEHVILVQMSKIQKTLYKTFMNEIMLNAFVTANPLKAFAVCCKIWNHPDVLYNFIRKKEATPILDLDIEIDELGIPNPLAGDTINSPKKSSTDFLPSKNAQWNKSFDHLSPPSDLINHGPGFNPPGFSTNSSGKKNSAGDEIDYDWVEGLFEGYDYGLLENSAKLKIFLLLLDETIKAGERMLLFSQSLLTLNVIEEFLQKREIPNVGSTWIPGIHYYRLDGSTPAMERERLVNSFNAADTSFDLVNMGKIEKENKPRPLLFMISTRAGSLGINLTGASRVVIFDASWNPCHDSQAVCRIYRYGQTRCCHIYRLVTDGSLERKIYDRQINKQGMSNRIVDEMNPDAYLHSKDVHSLLCLEEDEPRGNICKQSGRNQKVDPDAFEELDPVLAKVLRESRDQTTAQPFTHESLLIDRKEKKLSKTEKRMAERSYKIERSARISYKRTSYADYYPQAATSQSALTSSLPKGKYSGSSGSINNVSNMNLNLKRNSYASFYNNQEPPASQGINSSLPKSSTSRISHLYQDIKNSGENPTLVHPLWPASQISQQTSCFIKNGPNKDQCHSIPVQQKLPPNLSKPSYQDNGQQQTLDSRSKGIILSLQRLRKKYLFI